MSRKSSAPVPPPCLVEPLPRGLSFAPWVGPEGEAVLLVITSQRRKLTEVVVPWGANRLELEDKLLGWLDEVDPPAREPLRLA